MQQINKKYFHFRILSFVVLLLLAAASDAQTIKGIVTDKNFKPLAFASIKFCGTTNGLVTDLNGNFSFVFRSSSNCIEVSYSGYQTKKIDISKKDTVLNIALETKIAEITEVVVSSGTKNKLKRILNNTVARRDEHNPEKYDEYKCNIYYKMALGLNGMDSIMKVAAKDTSAKKKERKPIRPQHVLVTETYSKRFWKKPQQLQEQVIAAKVSGFKNPLFANLVTDVLPFHAYNDFITLNGKDYHSPISKGLFMRYDFFLEDELLIDNDTLWIINFTAKKNLNELSGSLFINSADFALTQFLANTNDTILKRNIKLEQQYSKVNGKWFPNQLNYNVQLGINMGDEKISLYMNGKSMIDSVETQLPKKFKFDKEHTVQLMKGSEKHTDSSWKRMRPVELDTMEQRTYVVMDSISKVKHLDELVSLAVKIADAKVPVGAFDINLGRFYNANPYEKTRFGLGLQTNEKILENFSVGGWFGYGTKDKEWKYGVFAEFYGDRYKEFVIKASYDKDIQAPGTLQINKELNKNYVRRFLLTQVDATETYKLSIQKKLGYLTASIDFSKQLITPKYDYALENHGRTFETFTAREIGINLRYAYAERTSPAFGKYFSNGTKYPIVYGNVNYGKIDETENSYVKVIAAISWQKHFNRWGKDRFLLIAGKTFSNEPLPLGKIFAGNGFASSRNSLYVFGGMQTMKPFEYYMDRFVNLYIKHDFDFRFYHLSTKKKTWSSAPFLSLAYNGLIGNLSNVAAQQKVTFSIPDNIYHEAGAIINSILRVNYFGLNYIGLNLGYFNHIHSNMVAKDSKYTIGISADF